MPVPDLHDIRERADPYGGNWMGSRGPWVQKVPWPFLPQVPPLSCLLQSECPEEGEVRREGGDGEEARRREKAIRITSKTEVPERTNQAPDCAGQRGR